MPFRQRSPRPILARSHSSILKSPRKKLARTGQWFKDLVSKIDNGAVNVNSDDDRGSSPSLSARSGSIDLLEEIAALNRTIASMAAKQKKNYAQDGYPDIDNPQPVPGYLPIGYATWADFAASDEPADSPFNYPIGHFWYDEHEANDIRLKNNPNLPGIDFEHPSLDARYDELGIQATPYDMKGFNIIPPPTHTEPVHQFSDEKIPCIQTESVHHYSDEKIPYIQAEHVHHIQAEPVYHVQNKNVHDFSTEKILHTQHDPAYHFSDEKIPCFPIEPVDHIKTEDFYHAQTEDFYHAQTEPVQHVQTEQLPDIHTKLASHTQTEYVPLLQTDHVPHIMTKSLSHISHISHNDSISNESDDSEDEDAIEARLQEVRMAQVEASRKDKTMQLQRKAERQVQEKLVAITESRCSSLGLMSADGYDSDDGSQQSFLSHDNCSDNASQHSSRISDLKASFDRLSQEVTSILGEDDDNVAITSEQESIFIQEHDGTTAATSPDCQVTLWDEASVTAVEHVSPRQSVCPDQVDEQATEPNDALCYLPDLATPAPKDGVRGSPGTNDPIDADLDKDYVVAHRKKMFQKAMKRVARRRIPAYQHPAYHFGKHTDLKANEKWDEGLLPPKWDLTVKPNVKEAGVTNKAAQSIFGPAIVKDDEIEDTASAIVVDEVADEIANDEASDTCEHDVNFFLTDAKFSFGNNAVNGGQQDNLRHSYGLTTRTSSEDRYAGPVLDDALYKPGQYKQHDNTVCLQAFAGKKEPDTHDLAFDLRKRTSQFSILELEAAGIEHADEYADMFSNGLSSPSAAPAPTNVDQSAANDDANSPDLRGMLGIKASHKKTKANRSSTASTNSSASSTFSTISTASTAVNAAPEKPARAENHPAKLADISGYPGQFRGRMTAAQGHRRHLFNAPKMCIYMGRHDHLNNVILHKDMHACQLPGADYSPGYLDDNPDLETCLAYGHEMTRAAEITARTPAEEAFRVTVHRELAAARLEGQSIGEYRYFSGFLTVEEYHGRRMCVCFGVCECSKQCSRFGDMLCPCWMYVETCCK